VCVCITVSSSFGEITVLTVQFIFLTRAALTQTQLTDPIHLVGRSVVAAAALFRQREAAGTRQAVARARARGKKAGR
jgi:hypothetical protein